MERDKCREAALRRLQGQASSSSAVNSSDPTSGTQPEGQRQNGASEPFRTSSLGSFAEAGGGSASNGDVIDLEEDFDHGVHLNEIDSSWGERWRGTGFGGDSSIPSTSGLDDGSHSGQAVSCPVCNKSWKNLSNLELNQHIDTCLSDDVLVLE